LKSLIDRVIEVVTAGSGCDRVRFKVSIGTGVKRVHVNAVQIEQVLLNLVRNSCQAMTGIAEPTLLFRARRAENGTLLEITDNGPGIPRERLPNLFSAARGSNSGGLGIGLSISRAIVEAHGGSIMAQNAPEGGASFYIFLPDERSG
jgi:two-component system sensor kinase FixL